MNRIGSAVTTIVATAIVSMCLLPVGAAHAADIITVDAGDLVVTLPPTATAHYVIPYELVDEKTGALSVDDFRVNRGGLPVVVAPDDITVDVDSALSVLTVTVNADAEGLRDDGAYSISLRVASGDAAQQLQLSITRPPAELTGDLTIPILRTVWFPEIVDLDPDISDPTVQLTASEASRIAALTAVVTDADPATVTVTGGTAPATTAKSVLTITLKSPLGPGEALELGELISDEFPLGEFNRTVEICAPELDKPVVLTFEVTSRRHPALIVIFVCLGVLMGFLARVLPLVVKKRRHALARASEAHLQLTGLLTRYQDPTFRAALEPLKTQLASTWRVSSDDLVARADAAVVQANASLKALQDQLAPLSIRLAAADALVSTNWSLPRSIEDQVRRVRDLIAAAAKLCESGNVLQLDIELRSIDAALGSQLGDLVVDYGASIAAAATSIHEKFEQGVERPLLALGLAYRELSTKATLDRTTLTTPEDTLRTADVLRRHLANTLRSSISAVQKTTQIIDGRETPEARTDATRDALQLLADARTVLDDDPPESALERFEGIVTELKPLINDSTHGTEVPDKTPTSIVASPGVNSALAYVPAAERLSVGAQQAAWASVWTALSIVRVAILVLLLSIVSFRWFAEDWHGTLADIATIVVWAFGIDLSVELVAKVASTNPIPAGAGLAPAPAPLPPTGPAPEVVAGCDPVTDVLAATLDVEHDVGNAPGAVPAAVPTTVPTVAVDTGTSPNTVEQRAKDDTIV